MVTSPATVRPRPLRAAGLLRLVAEGGGLLLAVPLWVWWALDGGYDAVTFLPGIAALAGIAAALTLGVARPALTGRRRFALAAFAALAAWSALSVIWAGDRGAATVGAERAVLGAAAAALALLWPPSLRALRLAVGLLVAGVALAAALALAGIGAPGALDDGRLTAPMGYPNATAALLLAAAAAALTLGVVARPARRSPTGPDGAPAGGAPMALAARLGRDAALGAGGGMAATALLTQSRGSIVLAAVAAGGVVWAAPGRGRALVTLGLLAAALAAASGPLLDVRRAALAGDGAATAASRAQVAVALVALAMALSGPLLDLAGRHLPRAPRAAAAVRRARRPLLALVLLALAVVFVVRVGDPAAWASSRVHDFRTPDYAQLESGGTRFGDGLGSNRYDYWRVAVNTAVAKPLTGVGVETFAAQYLVQRHSDMTPRFAHSLWLGTAAELGLPGLALLVAALVGLLSGAVRALRRAPPAQRTVRAAATLPLVVVLVSASADWTWAFAGLAVPALALAAGAGFARPDGAPLPAVRLPALRRWAPAAVLALAAATTIAPYAAARLTDRAAATTASHPAAALTDLRRATSTDPLSATSALREGILALQLGRAQQARAAFATAARRDDTAWYPRLMLAALGGPDAVAAAQRAAALNPRQPVVARVRRALATATSIDPLAVQREILEEPR
jgi:O-Antigen ligase